MRLRHHGCGKPLTIEDVTMEAGPSGRADPGTRVIPEFLHRQDH